MEVIGNYQNEGLIYLTFSLVLLLSTEASNYMQVCNTFAERLTSLQTCLLLKMGCTCTQHVNIMVFYSPPNHVIPFLYLDFSGSVCAGMISILPTQKKKYFLMVNAKGKCIRNQCKCYTLSALCISYFTI